MQPPAVTGSERTVSVCSDCFLSQWNMLWEHSQKVSFIMRICCLAPLERRAAAPLLRAALRLPHYRLAKDFNIPSLKSFLNWINKYFLLVLQKSHTFQWSCTWPNDIFTLQVTFCACIYWKTAVHSHGLVLQSPHTGMSIKIAWARLGPGLIYDSSFDPARIKDSPHCCKASLAITRRSASSFSLFFILDWRPHQRLGYLTRSCSDGCLDMGVLVLNIATPSISLWQSQG